MGSLGRYELLQQLGAGSMGTVYLARDNSLLREIALKTIKTGLDVDEEIRTRFLQEARVCACLQHPNIVTVYEFGEHESFAYIAMELLHGSDLRKLIEQPSAIPLKVKLEAMIQVCEALGFAHRQGVVHRDVKPSNLMLCTDNRAKVLDFGIAHLPSSRLTVVGRVMGTPNYMAPEQVLGKKSDGRADLFSAAIVFFEFLVGKHPFEASLIPRRILDGEPDSIFDHDSSIPLPFEKIFAKALDKDPANRYATGEEFASDLRAILDAIRMNASPKFSKLFLPSTRAVPGASAVSTKIVNEAPGTDDPESQRMAEFIRLLTSFDEAVARGLEAPAREMQSQLKQTAGTDPRFRDSLESCDVRLKVLAGGPGTAGADAADQAIVGEVTTIMPATKPGSGTSSGTSICAVCGAENRLSAAFCVGCGTPVGAAAVTATSETEEAASSSPGVAPPEGPVDKPILDKSGSASDTAPPRTRLLIIVCAAAAAVLLAVIVVLLMSGGAKEQPFIATAKVTTSGTPLLASAGGGASKMVLDQGTPVHILGDLTQGNLLAVQPVVSGKLRDSGFIKSDSASPPIFKDAGRALAFARASGPGSSGTLDQVNRQITAYQQVAAQFPGKAEARTASVQAARLALDVAKQKKSAGVPEAEWDIWVNKSKQLLSGLPSDTQIAALQSEGDGLRQPTGSAVPDAGSNPTGGPPSTETPVVDGTTTSSNAVATTETASTQRTTPPATTPPTATPPAGQEVVTPVSPAKAAEMLAEAREMSSKGNYRDALHVLGRLLHTNPDDPEAQKLRRDVLNEKRIFQP